MKRVINYFAMLLLCIVTSALIVPTKAFADNRVISGPVEAYSSRAQECVFRLDTENSWRAECNYSFIHLQTPTGHWGDSDLKFTIDENTEPYSRMGWIVVYDQVKYSPIFTFEINQAGAGSPPPAVGPYFTNDIPALDDGYEAVSWNTTSYSFRFMSNRNITMKVNGNTVSPAKTRNSNGYTYTYTLDMGINDTANVKIYTVDVIVDGTNVSGGNRHTYRIAQNRRERFFKDLEIVGGNISIWSDTSYGDYVEAKYTTNDDFEAWLTWDSYPTDTMFLTHRTGPVTKVDIGSQNYLNGVTGTFKVLCYDRFEPRRAYRANVILHIKCKNSGITTGLRIR